MAETGKIVVNVRMNIESYRLISILIENTEGECRIVSRANAEGERPREPF